MAIGVLAGLDFLWVHVNAMLHSRRLIMEKAFWL